MMGVVVLIYDFAAIWACGKTLSYAFFFTIIIKTIGILHEVRFHMTVVILG